MSRRTLTRLLIRFRWWTLACAGLMVLLSVLTYWGELESVIKAWPSASTLTMTVCGEGIFVTLLDATHAEPARIAIRDVGRSGLAHAHFNRWRPIDLELGSGIIYFGTRLWVPATCFLGLAGAGFRASHRRAAQTGHPSADSAAAAGKGSAKGQARLRRICSRLSWPMASVAAIALVALSGTCWYSGVMRVPIEPLGCTVTVQVSSGAALFQYQQVSAFSELHFWRVPTCGPGKWQWWFSNTTGTLWRTISVPQWAIVVPLAGMACIAFFVGRRRPKVGECVACRYPLRGAAKCPECGRSAATQLPAQADNRCGSAA